MTSTAPHSFQDSLRFTRKAAKWTVALGWIRLLTEGWMWPLLLASVVDYNSKNFAALALLVSLTPSFLCALIFLILHKKRSLSASAFFYHAVLGVLGVIGFLGLIVAGVVRLSRPVAQSTIPSSPEPGQVSPSSHASVQTPNQSQAGGWNWRDFFIPLLIALVIVLIPSFFIPFADQSSVGFVVFFAAIVSVIINTVLLIFATFRGRLSALCGGVIAIVLSLMVGFFGCAAGYSGSI